MAEVSQELRQDIERIRDDLDTTLDALGERVSPRRIARRRTAAGATRNTCARRGDGVGAGVGGDGSGPRRDVAGSAKDGVQQVAGRAAEQVRDAPESIQQQTQGNPLAAGLIAFGAGLLLATAFPPTEAEQRAAGALQERVEPMKDQVLEAGREVKDHLQASAQESAQQVKEAAGEAKDEVKQQAQSSAENVKGQAD